MPKLLVIDSFPSLTFQALFREALAAFRKSCSDDAHVSKKVFKISVIWKVLFEMSSKTQPITVRISY